jgi:hypothetical protein
LFNIFDFNVRNQLGQIFQIIGEKNSVNIEYIIKNYSKNAVVLEVKTSKIAKTNLEKEITEWIDYKKMLKNQK